jgi:hypothetical protein
MSWVSRAHLAQMQALISRAQAWAAESDGPLTDWANPADMALVYAIDEYEAPDAFTSGRHCSRDAADEHPDLQRGIHLCARVPGHKGGCLYGSATQAETKRLVG